MIYKFCYLCVAFIIMPFVAFPNQNASSLPEKYDLSEKAWTMFENNRNDMAINFQILSIDSIKNICDDSVGQETLLGMLSDLILFQSDNMDSEATVAKALEIDNEFIRNKLCNTQSYYIHSARLGYYYCLSENFALSDSLTRLALDNVKLFSYTPHQSLEIHAYRVAYLLSKLMSISSLDYDYKDYNKIKNSYIKEANKIIAEGLKFAETHSNQSCIFFRYLLSMKEGILMDKMHIPYCFLSYSRSDNETKFKIYNNTKEPASFKLKEIYDAIVSYIGNGRVMESLMFLEPLVQMSIDCRGETSMASKLYLLISNLYLELYNFRKAKQYAQLSSHIDQHLGRNAYKDSIYHSIQLEKINSKYNEYESIKMSDPLYAFEQAIMAQGSIKAQDGRFEFSMGNFLSSENTKFDFDKLINELAVIHGGNNNVIYTLNQYSVNPYVSPKSSIIYEISLDEPDYYKDLRYYSSTLDDAKKIILRKLNISDMEEKSIFYHYLAKWFFYRENLKDAIEAQKKHLSLELQLSGNIYTKKVLDAQKTLSLLNMLGIWQSHKKKQIDLFQNAFIKIGQDYLLNVQKYVDKHFPSLNTLDQKALWTPLSNWFYNTIPYMGLSSQAAECIYNSALFSKGLLLSAATGKISTYCWEDIRSELNEDDMAIEIVNFRNIKGHEIYYAVAITKNCKYPSIYPLFSDVEYEDLNLIDEQHYNDTLMNDLILKPIEIQKDVKNIYFSPSGILNTIAIENIIDSDGKRACEKWNMYRLSSTRELLNRSAKSLNVMTEPTALIYGDLDYECSFNQKELKYYELNSKSYDRYRGTTRARVSPLKFSKMEIDTIASLAQDHKLPTILMRGSDGTEESIKFYTREPIGILHLSTHGFYYSDEKIAEDGLESDSKYQFLFIDKTLDSEDLAMTRSALVMSGGNNAMRGLEIPLDREDGLLTAMEISNLSLKQCDMVSLSACETALGKVSHEGVFGLQRGFKKAGAQSILMSLWEVPDKATCILMQEFYRNIFSGQKKIDALRNAQAFLRNAPDFADPYNWAGWIILDGLN